MISTQELIRLVRGPIAVAEPLGPYTGLRIGGTADYFIKPLDRNDLCRALGFFSDLGFPYFVLGRGSRLLVHDKGFRGTVISTHFLDRLVIDGEMVEADAGVPVRMLVDRAAQASLGGLEEFGTGVGTVGGALCRKEGLPGQGAGGSLEWVDVLRNGRVKRLRNGELRAGVRTLESGGDVVLGAGFRLSRTSQRNRPVSPVVRSAGPIGSPVDSGLQGALSGPVFLDPRERSEAAGHSAESLLDACGLKGFRHGGLSFSVFEANRIVNHGGASSDDVLELVRMAREYVQQRFGVELELGLVLVGYNMNENHGLFN
jgi:UDP-N-acetylmuramate dehydrogenase